MNKFIVGACAGVLSLAASQYAAAQTTTPAKPAAKKAPAKKTAKKAAPVAAAKPDGVQWKCELGNEFYVAGDMTRDQIIKLHWKGKNYDLPRQLTRTGAHASRRPARSGRPAVDAARQRCSGTGPRAGRCPAGQAVTRINARGP